MVNLPGTCVSGNLNYNKTLYVSGLHLQLTDIKRTHWGRGENLTENTMVEFHY